MTLTCEVPTASSIDPVTGLVFDKSNVIRVYGTWTDTAIQANTQISFQMFGILNPSVSLSEEDINKEFKITTLSPLGYPIDQSHDLDFSLGCVYPCDTCETTQTKCLSCLNQPDGTPLSFFAPANSCLLECPVGYRGTFSGTCEKCDSPCGTCSVDKNIN